MSAAAVERIVVIRNRLGLHARASSKLAQLASRFAAEVRLVRGDVEVNAKSIMGIMMLAAARGTELVLRAEGPDAEEALDAIEALINDRFGEDA
ncbi:MAG: HPr family phosphocarrier protein [Mariprofundaceae bacterium]